LANTDVNSSRFATTSWERAASKPVRARPAGCGVGEPIGRTGFEHNNGTFDRSAFVEPSFAGGPLGSPARAVAASGGVDWVSHGAVATGAPGRSGSGAGAAEGSGAFDDASMLAPSGGVVDVAAPVST
jgi:hypothetical protein